MQILLIDDDPEEHELFDWVLKRIDRNIKFYATTNCKDAIDDLAKEIYLQPNIIFVDGSMPEIDGKRCVLMIRENKSLTEVPIVIYSGSLSPNDQQELLAMGIYKYLEKPQGLLDLEKELSKILEAKLVM